MTPLLAALQAAVEPLPEDAPANAARTVADVAPAAAHNGIDMLALVLHASIPVQLVLVLLLFASVASWVIIFRKKRVLDRANHEAVRFEERFWSGAELSKLYAGATATSAGWRRSSKAASASSTASASARAWNRGSSSKARNARCARPPRASSTGSSTTWNSSPTSARSAPMSACSARCGAS